VFGILDISSPSENDGSDTKIIAQFAAGVSINSKRVISTADTISLKRITSAAHGQRWEVETKIFDTNFFIDFFVHNVINDINTSVFIRPPLPVKKLPNTAEQTSSKFTWGFSPYDSKFNWSFGTASVTSYASPGASTVNLAIANPSAIYKGDFVSFSNHSKLYMITGIIPGTNNLCSIGIFPALVMAIPSSTVAGLGLNSTMQCYYDGNESIGLKYEDGVLVEGPSIKFVEAL